MPRKKSTTQEPKPPRSVLPEKPVEVEAPASPLPEGKDAALLQEIRDDYRHFKDYWRENREDMETDMRFAGGDAFSPDEHANRDGDGRPCETPDELSQYVKQTNNNLRQNKRDCKISPSSEEATGEDAEKRESVLRGLNHRGNFQAAFQTAFECCTWCGFGYFGISLRKGKDGHIEPRPRRFPNQFVVLLDPYAKEADYSDQKRTFVLDIMRKSDFAREYKNATKRSFSADDAKMAPDWVMGDEIVVAEAWRVEDDGNIYQYITNGLEILDKIKWPGSWIPIIPILGEEIYVTEGGRTKRKYLSLIRRARTPQKMLAYIASQELEEFGMAPRAPFVGYKGQFTDPNWVTVNRKPRPYLEVEALPDPLEPQKLLPLPTRPQYTPNAQAYEIAREAWRRGVQSAIGITPLPTAAQRQNEKSGIALEKIQNQEAVGSYHFTDNADRALVNYGRQMNELIDKGMSVSRHVGTKLKDDTHGVLYLATPEENISSFDPENVLVVGKDQYDVTITTGPSRESQREEASDFVDTLIENLQGLPIPGPVGTKILSLAIKLKNVGPLGDEIAKLLDPQTGDPGQALAQLQQQAMNELQAELQQLRFEKAAKQAELQWKAQIESISSQMEKFRILVDSYTKQAVAEITTKAQSGQVRAEIDADERAMAHEAAHELALQKDQQAHDSNMADKNAVIAQAQAEQQAANQPQEPAAQ